MRASLCPGRAEHLRHPLHREPMLRDVHDRHPGDLPEPPLEVLVAGGDDEAPMLLHGGHDVVVGVGALFEVPGEPHEPLRKRKKKKKRGNKNTYQGGLLEPKSWHGAH